MSSPTAQRWFVSDDEYDTATEDYVFCNMRADVVAEEIALLDEINWDCQNVAKNFFTEAVSRADRFLPRFTYGARLMFADAHLQDPENWQGILKEKAKKPILEELPEDIMKAKDILCETLRKYVMTFEGDDTPSEDEFDSFIRQRYQLGVIDSQAVHHLIKQNGTAEQEATLAFLSGQGRMHERRPVLLFLDAIVDTWASTDQRKSGVASAYDLKTDSIIIKSFTYSKGQHPFTKSWFEKESEDAYYFQQHTSDFAASVFKPSEEHDNSRQTNFLNVAKYLAGLWVRHFWQAFGISEEVSKSMKDQLKSLHKQLCLIEPLPSKPLEDLAPEVVYEFNQMRCELLWDEDQLRDIAVDAMKNGNKIAAENMVKFFERSVRDLKQLAEHPETPLEI